jgi:hypothetical protein
MAWLYAGSADGGALTAADAASPQRRHMDLHDIDPVEQVGKKSPVFDFPLKGRRWSRK